MVGKRLSALVLVLVALPFASACQTTRPYVFNRTVIHAAARMPDRDGVGVPARGPGEVKTAVRFGALDLSTEFPFPNGRVLFMARGYRPRARAGMKITGAVLTALAGALLVVGLMVAYVPCPKIVNDTSCQAFHQQIGTGLMYGSIGPFVAGIPLL